ncbi:hypothetical protein SRHO_G00094660 [Serrasalmus rhombeus]
MKLITSDTISQGEPPLSSQIKGHTQGSAVEVGYLLLTPSIYPVTWPLFFPSCLSVSRALRPRRGRLFIANDIFCSPRSPHVGTRAWPYENSKGFIYTRALF